MRHIVHYRFWVPSAERLELAQIAKQRGLRGANMGFKNPPEIEHI